MAGKNFTIKLNSGLVAVAEQMHQTSRVGDERRGPNQSIEAYLSDLVSAAIVERRQQGTVSGNREKQLLA
jgi:hypothetical protein